MPKALRGRGSVVAAGRRGRAPRRWTVRPFLSGRDYHALHHENPAFPLRRGAARPAASCGFSRMPACPRSWSGPTAPTPTRPTGTATSSTRRSARAASTSRRIWPRPATFRFDSRRRRGASCSWPPRVTSASLGGRGAAGGRGRRRCGSPSAAGAQAFAEPARARRRRVPGAARRGPDDRRRLSRGSRTGAATRSSRCAACASRPAGWTRRGQILLEWAGAVSEGMLPNLFPDADKPPEFNSVDASLWYRDRGARVPRGVRGGRLGRPPSAIASDSRQRVRRDPDGLRARHALRHPRRRRRPARGRRAGRAADVDGRQGRRLGRDAAHRQAGRGAGAVDQRAAHRRALQPTRSRALLRTAHRVVRASASGTRRRAASTTSSTSTTSPGTADADVPSEPDLRGRRACRSRCSRASARAGSSTRSRRACRRRSACARWRADEPGYRPRYDGGVLRARRRLPPGHGLAVARRARSSTPGCASAAARARPKHEARQRFLAPLLAHLDAGRARARLGDRRRRAAAHAARLPVPGVVGGRRRCGSTASLLRRETTAGAKRESAG